MTNGSSEKANESFVLVNLSRRHKVMASWSRKGALAPFELAKGEDFAACQAVVAMIQLV